MNKMICWLVGICFVGSIFILFETTRAQDSSSKQRVRQFMQDKLQRAQEILEGLVLEDYDKISEHAHELRRLSEAAKWNVIQTPRYVQLTEDFKDTAIELEKAAGDSNLDGATLAYVQMTVNCVKCHKYVRNQKVARRNLHDSPLRLTLSLSP